VILCMNAPAFPHSGHRIFRGVWRDIDHEPKKWDPLEDEVGLDSWPASANAEVIKREMLPNTPFVLFNHRTHMVIEMGTLVADVNLADDVGWAPGMDWRESGWQVDPSKESRSFTRDGYWVPLQSLGLMHSPDLWFPLPEVAYEERMEQRLYRRNPQAVLSDRAYRACQLALRGRINQKGISLNHQ
jgi:hypothetical protein